MTATDCMTPGTLSRVPNQPKTKAYAVRIDDELRQAAMKRAEQDEDTFSDVVRKALNAYLETGEPDPDSVPPTS